MKKLRKLNLNDLSFMTDTEMKNIHGGYDLPEVTIYGDPCDSLQPCGEQCRGKACGEVCYDGARSGTCRAFPNVYYCKICWLN